MRETTSAHASSGARVVAQATMGDRQYTKRAFRRSPGVTRHAQGDRNQAADPIRVDSRTERDPRRTRARCSQRALAAPAGLADAANASQCDQSGCAEARCHLRDPLLAADEAAELIGQAPALPQLGRRRRVRCSAAVHGDALSVMYSRKRRCHHRSDSRQVFVTWPSADRSVVGCDSKRRIGQMTDSIERGRFELPLLLQGTAQRRQLVANGLGLGGAVVLVVRCCGRR